VDRADRELPDRRLARQHHRVGPVVDRVGHVADLGPGRGRLLDHALEHLGRDDHRLAGHLAPPDQVLLHDRHLGEVHLDPEVPAGDHQPVARLQDRVDLPDRLGLLDLGDHVDVAALVHQVLADQVQVVGLADERQREVVQVVLDRPVDALPVLVGDRRDRHLRVRQVDPLGALEDAADRGLALQLGVRLVDADEPEQPVLDHDPVADLDVVDEVVVDRADPACLADGRGPLDDQLVADGDRHAAGAVLVGDLAEPDLRAAEVAEDGDRVVEPDGGLADQPEGGQVAVEVPVGEVQPADVAAGVEQGEQRVGRRDGRPHGGDDLGADHAERP
jgi:hypothetical protein